MKSHTDLNISDSNKDYVNIFIVYRLTNRSTNHHVYGNGLFGHGNGVFDKFL